MYVVRVRKHKRVTDPMGYAFRRITLSFSLSAVTRQSENINAINTVGLINELLYDKKSEMRLDEIDILLYANHRVDGHLRHLALEDRNSRR